MRHYMKASKKAKRRNLTITDADYAWLQKLGNGNASKGVRAARALIDPTNGTQQQRRAVVGLWFTNRETKA